MQLTDRQLQCIIFVGRGLTEAEIARRLDVSAETVKRHLKDAREAMGVKKSVQLVIQALDAGIITLSDLVDAG